MSESESSDTTHEAILHNLVAHQAALKRQISQVQTDLQFVKDQLSLLLGSTAVFVRATRA